MTSGEGDDQDWEDVPRDPDPVEDLGYDRGDFRVFKVDDGGRYLFLPMERDLIDAGTYIVVDDRTVYSPGEYR